jgi:predicted kinase
LDQLGIAPQDNFPDPAPYSIGILIGQQGSGKSTYSDFLEEEGYIIIREKEAEKIRNRRTQKAIKEFKETIDQVLKCKKKKTTNKNCSSNKTCLNKAVDNSCRPRGIIIDATNASEESRQVYNEIAEEMGIDIVNLWLSKSGFDYNSKRESPVSKIALYTYAKNLQLPEDVIRVL